MKSRLLPAVFFLPLVSSTTFGGEAENALLQAAKDGDAPRIVLSLSEADPNIRDKDGRTPLMLAAKSGDFESVRRLLWGGANCNLKDNSAKSARDLLDSKGEAFAPLSIILRAYAFCQEYARPPVKASIPHLTLINDNWVDPFHPALKSRYSVNQIELNGKPGTDDDQNGFEDDIYGWNFQNDEALRAPRFSTSDSEATTAYLRQLIKDYLATLEGDEKLESLLKGRYLNPLVKQVGFSTLKAANIDINDYVYADMFYSASHGTHVAGIINRHSDGKALLHGSALGATTPPTGRVFTEVDALAELAAGTDDYAKFVTKVLELFRKEAIGKGRRASDYLRTCGAGVANMSWGRPHSHFLALASEMKRIYRIHGKNPDSIGKDHTGADRIMLDNLPLELTIADAAAFALAFFENPDVLVVIAAGNENADNDIQLPSPNYLSRFFPNVITVASLDAAGKPSRFTNYGIRSVQIAAPGENIVSSILGDLEAPMSGTSMASPYVAGVAAGIRADFPKLPARDVRRLLEASAKHSPDLAKIVSTSGALDAQAARAMAASWSGDNLAMLVEEARSSKKPGRDGPAIDAPKIDTKALLELLELLPTESESDPFRITSVSGSGSDWHVSMSKGTPFENQRNFGAGPWPDADVKKSWDEGYLITSLAGNQDSWNIVMSSDLEGSQSVLGYSLDQSTIASNMEKGFRITSIAGWKDRWLTVMTTGTGWGKQRYTLPTPFTPQRQKWIQERWNEGYRITSVAGDDTPQDDKDGWLFVMTQDTEIEEQSFSVPGPWPAKWIADQSTNDFRVTSSAGSGNHTIVIMSKGTELGAQIFSPAGTFPSKWIGENW